MTSVVIVSRINIETIAMEVVKKTSEIEFVGQAIDVYSSNSQ